MPSTSKEMLIFIKCILISNKLVLFGLTIYNAKNKEMLDREKRSLKKSLQNYITVEKLKQLDVSFGDLLHLSGSFISDESYFVII